MEFQDSLGARVSPTRIDPPRSIPLPEICITPASPPCDGPVVPRISPVVKNEPLFILEENVLVKVHPQPSLEQTVNPFHTPDVDADGDSRLPDCDAASQVATQQGSIPGEFMLTQDTTFTDLSAGECANLARTPMFAANGFVMSDSSGKENANLEKPAEKPSESQRHGKHASGFLYEEPRPKRPKGKHIKEEHAEKPTLFAGEPPFAFLSPHKDATTRLILKEQAIEVCMTTIGKCKKLFADEIDQEEGHDEGIEDIIARIEKIEQKSRGHQVLVGVCGGTGVGKTSLLNACLGFDELLPSGQEAASTAVPCLVSYNNDNREGYECRAEVFFHDKETIKAELQSFLRAFAERTDAAEYGTLSEVEEFEAMISKGMDRFSPVWKFTEAQLEQLLQMQPEQCEVTGNNSHQDASHATTDKKGVDSFQDASISGNAGEKAAIEWVFGLNPDVQQLLSEGIRSLHTSTIPELANEVKRFLDSSECIHGGSTASAFAAWPLVKEVRLYVKSDLLQQDICLVDLPGVGDINSSRSSVAGHYMSRLHLHIVVGSIVRGKDTKDFNELLGAQQQASMQLDGTLNRNHLAIVFTKIDDMQAQKYHFHTAEDEKRYKTLADGLIQKKAIVTSINRDIKRVERGLTKARATMEKNNATKESISRTRKAVAKVCKLQKSLIAKRDIVQVQAEILRQQQTHLAILARNQHVRSCVEENFGKKQKLLDMRRKPRAGGTTSSTTTTTETPSQQMAEIFMTSSRAFWEIENKTGNNLCGLPNEQFTGVPALKQWIKKNAALHREGHMDDILSDLRVVLELIGTWARSASKSATLPEKRIDPRIIEASIEKVHDDQTKHIIDSINDTCDMIEGLDPLGDRQRLQRFFKRQESTIVERWNRKFPDDPTNHETLHHATYAAIAHRSGCFKSAATQVSYNWTQKLAQPILEGLVQSWQRALVDGVQDLKAKACGRIRWLWTPYARAILRGIAPIDPSFKTEIAELERLLEPSGVSLEKDVETIVSDFQEKATRIHHETISPTLQNGLRECFSRVSRIKGQGEFLARQAFLKDATTEGANFLFSKVWRALNDLIKDHRAEAQRQLRLLSGKSVADVKTAVRFWLRGGCAQRGGETVSKVRRLVRSCMEEWTFPPSISVHEFSKKLGIPDELTADDFGHDHAVMSVNGVNYYDKIKKGTKVLVGKNASQKVDKALKELSSA